MRAVKNSIESKELNIDYLKMFIIDEFDEVLLNKNNMEDLE